MILAAAFVGFKLTVPLWVVFDGATAAVVPYALEVNPDWYDSSIVECHYRAVDGIHHLEV
jgi:hypothetical protein